MPSGARSLTSRSAQLLRVRLPAIVLLFRQPSPFQTFSASAPRWGTGLKRYIRFGGFFGELGKRFRQKWFTSEELGQRPVHECHPDVHNCWGAGAGPTSSAVVLERLRINEPHDKATRRGTKLDQHLVTGNPTPEPNPPVE